MNLSEESKKALLLNLLGLENPTTFATPQTEGNGEWKIIVLQRGWVAVGRYYRNGTECRLEEASVIRRWGTTKGLGELALNGPQKDTKLDKSGIISFHLGAEVCRMACKTINWN